MTADSPAQNRKERRISTQLRRAQLVEYLVRGAPIPEIARALHASPRTIQNDIRALRSELRDIEQRRFDLLLERLGKAVDEAIAALIAIIRDPEAAPGARATAAATLLASYLKFFEAGHLARQVDALEEKVQELREKGVV